MAKSAAYGSALAIKRLQTGSFTVIAHVSDMSGPEISLENIDVTTHDSPDNYTEHVAGLRDGGTFTFELQFNNALAGHETLVSDVSAGKIHDFQLRYPGWVNEAGGGYWAFTGTFDKFTTATPVKGSITASVAIKLTQDPIFTKFAA